MDFQQIKKRMDDALSLTEFAEMLVKQQFFVSVLEIETDDAAFYQCYVIKLSDYCTDVLDLSYDDLSTGQVVDYQEIAEPRAAREWILSQLDRAWTASQIDKEL